MPDLKDGESAQVQGSARAPYILKNVGGVYSCSCPAWRNQSLPIERRTCKHLRKLRGEEAERLRLGSLPAPSPASTAKDTATASKLLLAHSWDNTARQAWQLWAVVGALRTAPLHAGRRRVDPLRPLPQPPAWLRSRLRRAATRRLRPA